MTKSPFHVSVVDVIDKPEVAARIINEQAKEISILEEYVKSINVALKVILKR